MKKSVWFLLLVIMGVSVAGCGDPCKEDMLTSVGDKLATMGKDGLEKDKILVDRKAKRAAECAEKGAGDMKKKIGF